MVDLLFGSILCGVSSFAITYIMRFTDGPLDVFMKIRKFVGIEQEELLDDSGLAAGQIEVIVTPMRFITKLYRCFYCLTTWVSLFHSILFLLYLRFDFIMFIPVWFGTTGISFLSYRLLENE